MLRRGISIIPHPQRIEVHREDFTLTPNTSVRLVGSKAEGARATAALLRRELARLLEREVPLTAERRRDQISMPLDPNTVFAPIASACDKVPHMRRSLGRN